MVKLPVDYVTDFELTIIFDYSIHFHENRYNAWTEKFLILPPARTSENLNRTYARTLIIRPTLDFSARIW